MDVNELYQKALKIATKAHKGQQRKFGADKGKPYIIHPIRVVFMLDGLPKVMGVLHDVEEDTDVTANDLRNEGIPESVIKVVRLLSKRNDDPYHDFITRIISQWNSDIGQWAIEVKIADINDNMMNLEDGSMKDKYRLAKELLQLYTNGGRIYDNAMDRRW